MKENKFKERINYTRDGEWYCGQSVNIPGIILQAKSLKELNKKAKIAFRSWFKMYEELLEQDTPFKFVELENPLKSSK